MNTNFFSHLEPINNNCDAWEVTISEGYSWCGIVYEAKTETISNNLHMADNYIERPFLNRQD